MSRDDLNLLVVLGAGAVTFGICLLVGRAIRHEDRVDTRSWSRTLSYVASTYGIIIGFFVLYLFGQFDNARQAVGDEATSIGTAFEQAKLFPEAGPGIQQALICYARAVPRYDWPAMRDGVGASEVDQAFSDLVASLATDDPVEPGLLQLATATNLAEQIGDISTARETRLVAASTTEPFMVWVLLVGGAALVLVLLFMSTIGARPTTHALLVSLAAMFTVSALLLVLALSSPFAAAPGRVSPLLIEQTTTLMERGAPALDICPPDG